MLTEVVVFFEGTAAATDAYRLLLASSTLVGRSELHGTTEEAAWVLLRVTGAQGELATYVARVAPTLESSEVEGQFLAVSAHEAVLFLKWRRPAEGERSVSLPHRVLDRLGSDTVVESLHRRGRTEYRIVTDRGSEDVDRLLDDIASVLPPFGVARRGPLTGPLSPSGEKGRASLSLDPVLATAFRLGYFDTPKKCGIREVAKAVELSPSGALKRVRAAERALLERRFGSASAPT